MPSAFESKTLPQDMDLLAPDHSEIRLMPMLEGGSMVHCTLPVDATSLAVTHRTVEELWFVLSGRGELWRKQGDKEETVTLLPNTAHTIPLGTDFQFRNTGATDLKFVIVTMPPWPGNDEAVRVPDHWATNEE